MESRAAHTHPKIPKCPPPPRCKAWASNTGKFVTHNREKCPLSLLTSFCVISGLILEKRTYECEWDKQNSLSYRVFVIISCLESRVPLKYPLIRDQLWKFYSCIRYLQLTCAYYTMQTLLLLMILNTCYMYTRLF